MIVMMMKTDAGDKGLAARLNQGKSTKRRRHDSGASGACSELEDLITLNIPKVPYPMGPADDRKEEALPNADLESPAFNLVKAFSRTTSQIPDAILSVIRVKTFKKYGYNYLREIILRQADYKEYKISEKDFKNLHINDFEDMYLLDIQDKLNHLSKSHKIHLHTAVNMWIRNLVIRNRVGDLQLRIESYQTKLNLERPNWDATDYSFKEDYTIVLKPRAVMLQTTIMIRES
ncbi:hypothetical protein Tco_0628033 [Tanacetum coccineum]|uniref:Uncharacterized protein n=1 Tax=Tanacetum coccineum TaxID=301880 RepID=A0ABQ4WP44_9ASTR